MPAAAAAEKTSRFRAGESQPKSDDTPGVLPTFVLADVLKRLGEQVGNAAGNMYKRPLLTKPHTRTNREALRYAGQSSSLLEVKLNLPVPTPS